MRGGAVQPKTVIDKRLVKRRFDRHAHEYDKYTDIQRDMIRFLLEHPVIQSYLELHQRTALHHRNYKQLQAPVTMLDVGCGTGSLALAILEVLPQATISLLDLSPNMLQQAVAKITGRASAACIKETITADAEHWLLEHGASQYDFIISSAAFQWFNTPHSTLLAAIKRLRPGGLLAFTTFLPGTLRELHDCCAAADQHCHSKHSARGQDYPNDGEWTRWLEEACANEPASSPEGFRLTKETKTQLPRNRYWWSEHELTYQYPNVEALLQHVRRVGAGNALATPNMPVSKRWLNALKHEYLKRYRCGEGEGIQATYRVAVGCVLDLSTSFK
ncbi:methyltransferase [Paenibacillus taiwanensis]|uniref:methyltransferase n=1 Tax=Paenibacillus taiwanensis TaxID=401638 RepID=UPI00042613FC|nr:methyltransferase [Paenibacillus taiwanensis]